MPALRSAVLGWIASAALVTGASAAELYVGDIDTDDVSTVDSVTASAALVGNLGEDLSFGGFAYDSSTSTMYISDITLPPVDGKGSGWGLATVDLATGAATIIGGHVNSNNIWGLAYDSANDVLYGADGSNEGLATIDRATGESTLIGPYDPEVSILICGLAYDAGADTIYGVSAYSQVPSALPRPRGNGLSGEPGEGVVDPSALFVLDRATGAAT